MNIQAIDLVEIGAGGRLDRARRGSASSRSGPRARRRTPGPVCYGRGGDEPTVTDANLVLGYLNPDVLRRRLDAARTPAPRRGPSRSASRGRSACRSRRRRGASTRSSTPTWSWPRAWCRSSAAATRATSRSSPSAAPGPCTAAGSPRRSGIPRVILPAAAGVTAAIGLLAAEVRFDVARTYVRRLDALDPRRARRRCTTEMARPGASRSSGSRRRPAA